MLYCPNKFIYVRYNDVDETIPVGSVRGMNTINIIPE